MTMFPPVRLALDAERTLFKDFTIRPLLMVSLVSPLLACRIYGWVRNTHDEGVYVYMAPSLWGATKMKCLIL